MSKSFKKNKSVFKLLFVKFKGSTIKIKYNRILCCLRNQKIWYISNFKYYNVSKSYDEIFLFKNQRKKL